MDKRRCNNVVRDTKADNEWILQCDSRIDVGAPALSPTRKSDLCEKGKGVLITKKCRRQKGCLKKRGVEQKTARYKECKPNYPSIWSWDGN